MVTRNIKGCNSLIKGSTGQKDIKIVNIYASMCRDPRYMKQISTALKGETDSIITVDFNNPTQKISEETEE